VVTVKHDTVVTHPSFPSAGGSSSYVPLDSDFPRERIRFVLLDVDERAVVAAPGQADVATDGPWTVVTPDDVAEEPGTNLDVAGGPDDVAHVISTSRPTGEPKGVVVTHRAIR
jgi:surfactin family lipopeptide synthetase C/lichenysin synthetase C